MALSKLNTRIIDLGNYNIKLDMDIDFISTFTEVNNADQSEKNILELKGTKFRMEYEGGAYDPEFNKAKKDYIPNLLWALDKGGVNFLTFLSNVY